MAVRRKVLICVYKLGGVLHEIETSQITKTSTNSANMDSYFQQVTDPLFVGSASHTLNLYSKLPLNLLILPQDQRFAVVIDDAFTVPYGADRISAPHEPTSYVSYYIGGLPAPLRRRKNSHLWKWI